VTFTKKAIGSWWESGVQAHQPVCQVRFLFDSSSKRRFSSANFYIFDKSFADLGGVRLSELFQPLPFSDSVIL